jgi:hypothetical protein
MRPGLEARALGFLNLEPGPSLKARAKPCVGPARLRALSLARHITTYYASAAVGRHY